MDAYVQQMNQLGRSRTPFLFILDFELRRPMVIPLQEIDTAVCQFSIPGIQMMEHELRPVPGPIYFEVDYPEFSLYRQAFQKVLQEISYGNSFLVNLTMASRLQTNLDLYTIFQQAQAPFKLWLKNKFVVFSPEPFVSIRDGTISSFPMKGTIDAAVPDAAALILNNRKEKAEHYTIVDLIRNDLSRVASQVRVRKFREIGAVTTSRGDILQVSSHLEGILDRDFHEKLGEIFEKLLPAGSISGAPKKKTLEIIAEVEGYKRGYYTGVFGVFDGQGLESAVMIRYIEQDASGELWYKSGGGITINSDLMEEYEELKRKVYVPFSGKHPG